MRFSGIASVPATRLRGLPAGSAPAKALLYNPYSLDKLSLVLEIEMAAPASRYIGIGGPPACS